MRVFVKNMRGDSLMPCAQRKARLLIKTKQAIIIGYTPFTIQLTSATGETTQETTLGVDLGSKHMGLAVVSEDKVLAKGEIELRQDVSSNLETRKTYRRSRRNRKTRYRHPKFKFKTIRTFDKQKQKWVKSKMSSMSDHPVGWLPPSIQSRIDNTCLLIDTYRQLLPDARLHIEVGKFDIQKMINPNISGKQYQQGSLYTYHDVRYYVFARDNYTCQICKKKKDKILNTHHIIYRSHGGTHAANNLITVCTDCHTNDNHKQGTILWQWMFDKKKVGNYKAPLFMNTLRKHVCNRYPEAHITYGSITTPHRMTLGLEKSHSNDAIAITGVERITQNPDSQFLLKQFRKKKRSLHEATARKGRKQKNTEQKRNAKNTKESNGFFLNDKVHLFGKIGFITGFTTSGVYVKDSNNQYITVPTKSYKQVGFKNLLFIHHQNNWQFIPHLPSEDA